jgi:hypothetical protein
VAKLGSFTVVQKTAVQANSTSPREPDVFEFEGEEFRVVDSVPSLLPLMQFSAAMSAVDDGSIGMDGLAAIYNMLRYCVHAGDWARFEKLAMQRGAGPDDLLPITESVWEAITARPTEGPSGSPDGPSNTGTSSRADSPSRKGRRSGKKGRRTDDRSTPDVSRLKPANEWTPPPGRPDLAMVHLTPVEDLTA